MRSQGMGFILYQWVFELVVGFVLWFYEVQGVLGFRLVLFESSVFGRFGCWGVVRVFFYIREFVGRSLFLRSLSFLQDLFFYGLSVFEYTCIYQELVICFQKQSLVLKIYLLFRLSGGDGRQVGARSGYVELGVFGIVVIFCYCGQLSVLVVSCYCVRYKIYFLSNFGRVESEMYY